MTRLQCVDKAKPVSNPIREYLQILAKMLNKQKRICFKPYKGVSSNTLRNPDWGFCSRFKPYKGVSSNGELARHREATIRFQTL